jgi:phosphoribosylanthranilate isomerase
MKKETEMRDMEQMDARYELYDFRPESPDYVRMISSQAGIMPDYSEERLRLLRSSEPASEVTGGEARKVLRVGIFADDMPQNIVTRVYNYRLDVVWLKGAESQVMIDNLRRTLDPDIRPGIQIVKELPGA